MHVAMYYRNSDVRLEEVPKPQIGCGELLVKVKASGICGSDVMEWYRLKRAPLVLGHEIAGEVVETGKGVSDYKVGDRVFVSHHVPCNSCRYCLSGNHTVCETLHTTNYYPGGFSEYIQVPRINVERGVFLLPDGISFEEGTFVEPLACVLRGQRMVNLSSGQTVLILGTGISGLLHLLTAIARGAKRVIVTDINEYRLKKALDLGAALALGAKEDVVAKLKDANEGRLADLVIVCTSSFSAFQQALRCVDRAGSLLFFAPTDPGVTLPIPVNDFWRQSIKIAHSYGASPSDLSEAVKVLGLGRIPVHKLITHRLSLKEAGLGFKIMSEGRDCVKVIIDPQKN